MFYMVAFPSADDLSLNQTLHQGVTKRFFLVLAFQHSFCIYQLEFFGLREYFSCLFFFNNIVYSAFPFLIIVLQSITIFPTVPSLASEPITSASFGRFALVLNNSLSWGWNQLILQSSASLNGELIMIWALAMHLFPSITISGPFSIKTTIPTHPLAYSQLGLHSNASSSLLILGLRLFSAVRKLLQTLSLSTSKVISLSNSHSKVPVTFPH